MPIKYAQYSKWCCMVWFPHFRRAFYPAYLLVCMGVARYGLWFKLSMLRASPITEKPFVVDFCNKNVINLWWMDNIWMQIYWYRTRNSWHGTTSNHQFSIFKSKECFKKLTRLQKNVCFFLNINIILISVRLSLTADVV